MNRSERETSAACVRGVYLLTPDTQSFELDGLLSVLEVALEEGITAIQYRNKPAPAEQREAESRRVVELAHRFGAIAIINDDPALAVRIDADGAHVGRDDTETAKARSLLGAAQLGVSCYADLELGARAVNAGADVIAFGAIYPSTTKPNAVSAPLALLTRARGRFSQTRVVAIGGINEDNIQAVAAAGAHAAAVISAVFSAANPRIAIRRLIEQFFEGQARYESQRATV